MPAPLNEWHRPNRRADYEVCLSSVVIAEISNAPEEHKNLMLKAVEDFHVLEVTDEALALADDYVEKDIFPKKYKDDAVHVAVAATNGIGILLIWNFNYLVKVKTRRMVALVNTEQSYLPVEIIAPPEL